ncbi:MAG: tetratricopeptide repeat protein [Spirochaetota bacterium]
MKKRVHASPFFTLAPLLLAGALCMPGGVRAQNGELSRIADDTRFNNAYYFVTMDMPEKAALYLGEYIEVYQDGIHRKEALMALGDIYYQKFEYERARSYYMMLFEEYPNTEQGVEAYYRSALCFIKMGMPEKADAVFTDIVDNYPQYTAAENARLQRDIESMLDE